MNYLALVKLMQPLNDSLFSVHDKRCILNLNAIENDYKNINPTWKYFLWYFYLTFAFL